MTEQEYTPLDGTQSLSRTAAATHFGTPCATCASSKPCIMCKGSGMRPWSRLGYVNCPACWGTGIDHD